MTGLGYAPEVSVLTVLDYVQAIRGASGPVFQDEEKPQQMVLLDAEGKRWTAETDGGVIEVRDERGRNPLVFETKTEWFKSHETDRMLLSLESLLAVNAIPHYQYGGGHIKIRVKPYFELHPLQFASLINLLLKYEPILNHLMMHQKRTPFAKPLGLTRMNPKQLQAAGLDRHARTTLAQYLGHGLNAILSDTSEDCRLNPALKRRFDEEQKLELSLKENCVLAWLAHFATDVVGEREYGINLQSWRGAPNPVRLTKAIELRFFNAPTNTQEAILEEALVRALADQAIRAGDKALLYEERIDAAYDLDSYYLGYFPQKRISDFRELILSSGFDQASLDVYLKQYLDDAKWIRRRSAP
jgi:hypothetical protein